MKPPRKPSLPLGEPDPKTVDNRLAVARATAESLFSIKPAERRPRPRVLSAARGVILTDAITGMSPSRN